MLRLILISCLLLSCKEKFPEGNWTLSLKDKDDIYAPLSKVNLKDGISKIRPLKEYKNFTQETTLSLYCYDESLKTLYFTEPLYNTNNIQVVITEFIYNDKTNTFNLSKLYTLGKKGIEKSKGNITQLKRE